MNHLITQIVATPATPHSLSGHEATCSCGFTIKTSLSAFEAGFQMRLHIELMAAQAVEKKGRRKAA